MHWRNKTRIALLIGVASGVCRSNAGTVLTNNLPINTAIVNIDARADGAAGYNYDQAFWYYPFNTGGTVLRYTVQPGTYSFRVINPSDAAALYPSLTSDQTNQIFTAWTYNSPWITDYLVFDGTGGANGSAGQLFDGGYSNTTGGPNSWITYNNASDAYAGAVANGFYDFLRTAISGGRDSTINLTSYTFHSVTILMFAVPDYDLGDNSGGVSVLISPYHFTPALSVSSAPDSVTVRWATNGVGYTLAETADLQNPAWQDEVQSPVIVGTNYSLTLPMQPGANRFFRLHNP